MSHKRECLNCSRWKPIRPTDWNPKYQGQEFGIWYLRELIGQYPEWNNGWPGTCNLWPKPTPTQSIYACGQWDVNDDFLRTWEAMWSQIDYNKRIDRLTQELKAARKLATDRFHQLQKVRKPTARASSSVPDVLDETSSAV
jgi:hypothetical protein